jgi:hypothetical protein
MSTQYRLVQSGKTASGSCSASQGSSEPVAPRIYYYHHHNHHHHVPIKELGHVLARSGLTHPEVSSAVFFGSFCLLECSILSLWAICYVAFDFHVISLFSCIPAFCLKRVIFNSFASPVFVL